ncbi:serine hydrolase domain-containing protein [Kordia sp.]|uniref:serine hydrolase domain-containing protein n=1 Tax=Kordia sp. TaxID=1965332 RepID=UPI003D295082
MRRTIIYLIIIFLCVHSVLSQEVKKAQNNLVTIDASIATIITANSDFFPNNTQLSIALIDGNSTKYIGVIRNNDSLQTIDNKEAIFEIGSITKVFTSLLFSNFINAGKLKATDKLFETLNIIPTKAPVEASKITLQMLANHASGLPRLPQNIYPLLEKNMRNPYKEYSTKLLDSYLNNEIVLENTPGTTSTYSNLGVGILGYVLTKKSNQSYEALLQKYILKPLAMEHSTTLLATVDTLQLVSGLDPDGSKTANWDFSDALVGAGGIKSNVVDMEKFIRKNFENDVVYNLPQQSTIKINETTTVGLGWHIISQGNRTFLFHNGGTGGYLSCMVIDKKSKKAALVLSNVSAFGPHAQKIDKLCFSLMKTL